MVIISMVIVVDANGLYRIINVTVATSSWIYRVCLCVCMVALLHLHSERGVDAVVEVEVVGAVVGPVSDPQVTVSDSTVQLVLYSELLQTHGVHSSSHELQLINNQ